MTDEDPLNQTAYCFFDRVMVRAARVPRSVEKLLRENCRHVDLRTGHPIRHSDRSWLISMVNPNRRAQECLAEQTHLHVSGIEIAADLMEHDVGARWHWFQFQNDHFLQTWRGQMEVRQYPEGFSTRTPQGKSNRGHWFTVVHRSTE